MSSDIWYMEYPSDLILGEGLCIFTSFHFPNSGLYLLNGFDFFFIYLEHRQSSIYQAMMHEY